MRDRVELERKARYLRRETLEMIVGAGKGHIGGSYSCLDILVGLYYGGLLRFDSRRPDWPDRDRLILSKGHGVLGIYPILADLGFFPNAELKSFTGEGSILGGHPDIRVPGVETVTGSLGHGLSVGAGIALAGKLDGARFKTVVLLGDGECHEGSVWEAALFAAHQGLDNLVGIVDHNRICATGFLDQCLRLDPLEEKWRAFGWDTASIDGHSFDEIFEVFDRLSRREAREPFMIVARTSKGRGVSFMEDRPQWHHGVPKGQDLELARRELS